MANTANDNVVNDNISATRAGSISYDTSYITFRWDNIAANRIPIATGSYASPGPGIGIGQIFPTRQDR
jgi:hypothetical protein